MASTDNVSQNSGNGQPKTPSKKVKRTPSPSLSPDWDLGLALGVDQNLPFSTPYQSPTDKNKDESLFEYLRGDYEGPSVRQLVAMRRMDGQATALYRLITLPIISAMSGISFVPQNGGTEEADFVTKVFSLPPEQGGMVITFERVMAQLVQGLFDGFSPFEKVFWRPTYGPLKGKYTYKKIAYRQPETITFITDEDGDFAGLRQRAYMNGKTVDTHIPRARAFYFAAQEEQRKFYGVSYFQSAFFHYDKKAKLYYSAHLAAQKTAVGSRVGTYPANATNQGKKDFAANLGNMALAQWMMLPEGYKVDLLKDSGGYDFLNIINHHNSQMSKSLLASFIDTSQGSGSNDRSLNAPQSPSNDMFLLMLNAIMNDIAAVINHSLIPQLIDWNFSDSNDKYPKFTWGSLTDEQKAAISSLFQKLAVTSGQNQGVTPEFMRKLEEDMAQELGLDVDYKAVDKREKEEKAAQDALQASGGVPGAPGAGGAPGTPGANPAQPGSAPAGATGAGEAASDDAVDNWVKQNVSLTGENDDTLLLMAQDLLDAATVELAGPRIVRTPEGAHKYGEAIGDQIVADPVAKLDPSITIDRLISLKRQMDSLRKLGIKGGEADDLKKSFIDALHRYASGRSQKEVNDMLAKLVPQKKKTKAKKG